MFEIERCLRWRDVWDGEMFGIERCLRWRDVRDGEILRWRDV